MESMHFYRSLRLRTLARTCVGTTQVLSMQVRDRLSTSKAAHISTPTARGEMEVRFLAE